MRPPPSTATCRIGRGSAFSSTPVLTVERRRRERELDEPVRRLAHDEIAEELGLEPRRLVEPLLGEALEDVDHERGRSAVGACPVAPFARLPEEQVPPDRVLLDRQRLEVSALVADARHVTHEGLRVPGGGVEEDRARTDVVDEAQLPRRRGAQRLAADREVERRPEPGAVRDAQRPVARAHHPDVHLGQAEPRLGVVAGDDRMARERELEPAPEARGRGPRRRPACAVLRAVAARG